MWIHPVSNANTQKAKGKCFARLQSVQTSGLGTFHPHALREWLPRQHLVLHYWRIEPGVQCKERRRSTQHRSRQGQVFPATQTTRSKQVYPIPQNSNLLGCVQQAVKVDFFSRKKLQLQSVLI
jgi:hypothetical protein